MTYKEIFTTKVDRHAMLYQIAPYDKKGLPPDSIFYKGRCGIGGTTLEIMFDRHSIIVVPNTPAIVNKCNDPDLAKYNIHGVMGAKNQSKEDKINKIIEVLQRKDCYIKIMTTPDSFDCIIEAAKRLEKLPWLLDKFFLLLDECHSFITEAFREKITLPFRYLWNFRMKCLISATPFEFSDPRFSKLDKHQILIEEKLGEIELYEVNDIGGIVQYLLANPQKFPANIHIFYNSITRLADKLKTAQSKLGKLDCHVYCSPKEENIEKLKGISGVFQEVPTNGQFAKINFYTTRYFEAWDLKDKDATIILITDEKAKNTKVGITNKGVQAVGRLRNDAHRIIHFTNHAGKDYNRELSYFKRKHLIYASDTVQLYNKHAQNCKESRIKPFKGLVNAVEIYATLSEDKYFAEIEIIKIDQYANHQSCNEEYNNMNTIKQAWEASNFDVIQKRIRPESMPKITNMLVEEQLKLAFERIDYLEQNKYNMMFSDDYEDGNQELVKVNANFELAFKAYHKLGREKVMSTGYSKKAIRKLLKDEEERLFKIQVARLITNHFVLDKYYSNGEAKTLLTVIYDCIKATGLVYNKIPTGTRVKDFVDELEADKQGLTIRKFKSIN